VRAAGGVVTDLTGADWTVASPSAVSGVPGVHGQLLELLNSVGEPGDY
jgi:myo-inositol-1(or 4)-monophosphatase